MLSKNDYSFLEFGDREKWDCSGQTWVYTLTYAAEIIRIYVVPDQNIEVSYKHVRIECDLERVEFSIRNTKQEIERLIEAVKRLGETHV